MIRAKPTGNLSGLIWQSPDKKTPSFQEETRRLAKILSVEPDPLPVYSSPVVIRRESARRWERDVDGGVLFPVNRIRQPTSALRTRGIRATSNSTTITPQATGSRMSDFTSQR